MTQEQADRCRELAAELWGCHPRVVECYWRSLGNPTTVAFERAQLSRTAGSLRDLEEQLRTVLWERHQLGHVSSGQPYWNARQVTHEMEWSVLRQQGFVLVEMGLYHYPKWLKFVGDEVHVPICVSRFILGFAEELKTEEVVEDMRRWSGYDEDAATKQRAFYRERLQATRDRMNKTKEAPC